LNNTVQLPPAFCQYASGPCDQEFQGTPASRAIFLYPAEPQGIAQTIEAAVAQMRKTTGPQNWRTWRDFQTAGQLIFCSICKNMRFADCVVADVTTLNFNLLFEIGFAVGLGLPIIPIRDTTFLRDKSSFEKLGILDVIGYVDFQNSYELAAALLKRIPSPAIPTPPSQLNLEASIYVIKSPIDTEGAVRLMSALKKSTVRFRSYDPLETPRLALQEARKQIGSSLAVVAHLLSPERKDALVHNARCAFVAGIAMATGKLVLLLQEGRVKQPIDYRDVVSEYQNPDQIAHLLEPVLLKVVFQLQDTRVRTIKAPEKLLERLNLGDVAAENEIRALRSYFVRTAQFFEAKRANARMVIGRKGSGKTAIFYSVRDSIGNRRSHLVLDLKPEGHQFTKLREFVLSHMSDGYQEHTLAAFWNYILLCELAHKVIYTEEAWARYDGATYIKLQKLSETYAQHSNSGGGDFSERLLRKVEQISASYSAKSRVLDGTALTRALFGADIRELDDAVGDYLQAKESILVLIDNLDKGWPTRGASSEDVLILRTLLEATRKLQRQFDNRRVPFHCLVFIRNDIYEHLIEETADKGKDTAIILDYDDAEFFKQMVLERIRSNVSISGSFDQVWATIFPTHIGTYDAFSYMVGRTLMRPRDLLNFLHRAVEVAINRGHDRVLQDDILKAEAIYSEDILKSISFEIRDVFPSVRDPLYGFLGCASHMTKDEITKIFLDSGFPEEKREEALKLLVWFGFLGVQDKGSDRPRFAYEVRHNIDKLLSPINHANCYLVVHPAFHRALECISLV
jgi:hypothetical protein